MLVEMMVKVWLEKMDITSFSYDYNAFEELVLALSRREGVANISLSFLKERRVTDVYEVRSIPAARLDYGSGRHTRSRGSL